MPLSILKDKGQITLPSSIRRQMHAEKGDIFDFQMQQDDKILMTLKKVVPANTQKDNSPKRKNLSKWIGAKPGMFKTANEVDQFIKSQRNLWS